MPMTCARCGAVNPDGNLYCQTCGTALTAPQPAVATAVQGPPPGPPPAFAPPVYSPGAYQSPYYVPSGAPAPVHRTPLMLIVAGIVAVVVVLAGLGTAFALLSNHTSNNTASPGSGFGSALPSPTPLGTPSPVASPMPPGGGPGTVGNDGLTMPVPAGWSVESKDSEAIVLYDPNNAGSVSAASGVSSPTQTAQDNMNTLDAYFKSQFPDARHCSSPASTTFNGAKGFSWNICFTITSGSHSVPGIAQVFAGANPSGSVYYLVMVVTRDANLRSYLDLAQPVLQGIHWKLG